MRWVGLEDESRHDIQNVFVRLVIAVRVLDDMLIYVLDIRRNSIPGLGRRRRGRLWNCLFSGSPTEREKGCYQENCTIRPLHVLSENAARA